MLSVDPLLAYDGTRNKGLCGGGRKRSIAAANGMPAHLQGGPILASSLGLGSPCLQHLLQFRCSALGRSGHCVPISATAEGREEREDIARDIWAIPSSMLNRRDEGSGDDKQQ